MKTEVVNLRERPVPDFDFYIGRYHPRYGSSIFRNPEKLPENATPEERAECIARYKVTFLRRVETDPVFRAAALALRGKRLGCWCVPAACHAEVIAEWVDAQPETEASTP